MQWEKLRYNEPEINEAGEILKKENPSEIELDRASEIVNNWRAVHNYPMHVFQMRLRDKAGDIDKNSNVVQRLKRTPAIKYKLKRKYTGRKSSISLYDMQDLGGCRAVLSNAKLIPQLPPLLKGQAKHKLIKVNDYITYPKKEDGYRSLHLIYSFMSDKSGKKEYNGLLTEIQIRSNLQNMWATAVEMMGSITRNVIKAHEGDPKIIEFFRLVSSAFAKMENCPLVPDTPQEERELYLQINKIEKEANVIRLMETAKKISPYLEPEMNTKKNVKHFLVELDIVAKTLKIKTYTDREDKKAVTDYDEIEKKNKETKKSDVVLIGANSFKNMRRAYPNYFLDIARFLDIVKGIINKY